MQHTGPWLLAGLFYLGSGLGLSLLRLLRRASPVRLPADEARWLAAAVLAGGVVAPVLLMFGLSRMPASGAALLLNAEGMMTALLAWIVFRENVDRRIAFGMLAIAAGALILGWPGKTEPAGALPALAVLGACLGWAIDNNLTRKVSLADADWIAAVKGLAAGSVNLALGVLAGDRWPGAAPALGALGVGFFAYGVSLVLFVIGMRHLGTARTGAYFSVAPFFGALLALAGGEPLSARLALAGGLMAVGVWLHLTERHEHEHTHAPLAHSHAHRHDDAHHGHAHDADDEVPAGARHTHWHRHEPVTHTHAHFPDAHHRQHRH